MKTVHTAGPKGMLPCHVRRTITLDIEAQYYGDHVWFRPDREWWEGLDAESLRTLADILEGAR